MKSGLGALSSVAWLCLAPPGCGAGSQPGEGDRLELTGTSGAYLFDVRGLRTFDLVTAPPPPPPP